MLALLTAYPAMAWLASAPSFERLLGVELWLSFLYGVYNGAMVVHLTEIMPPSVKGSGFSMAYSLATALGGFTPFIATALIKATGNKAMPGVWLSVAAAIGLGAVLIELSMARSPADRGACGSRRGPIGAGLAAATMLGCVCGGDYRWTILLRYPRRVWD